jgi:protocatechuate 3,4-dioxygenase alpha subunit
MTDQSLTDQSPTPQSSDTPVSAHRPPTASQTIGPFFRFGMAWAVSRELVDPASPGAVVIEGRVLDGDGAPVPDAMVEIWQADAGGRFPPDSGPGSGVRATQAGWSGFGRDLTDAVGHFRFVTVPPGPVDDHQAPHIDVSVFARGLLQRVVTRLYLPGDADAHGRDPLLSSIADPARRATLVAVDDGSRLLFDVRLQGDRETVFLDW